MTKTRTYGFFIFYFLEFGFVGKQKGDEKRQKGKAYNLMQCDQKTRTGGGFWNLVLLKNRREGNKAAIRRTKRRELKKWIGEEYLS